MSPDDRRPLPVGLKLYGVYRIEAVLGRGGLGITYRAYDTRLGRPVAVKEYFPVGFAVRDKDLTIKPASAGSAEIYEFGRKRFYWEARMLARIRHPFIVGVDDIPEVFNTVYMVARFEEGRTFGAWLDGLSEPPTQAELDRITEHLSDAVAELRAQEVVHCGIAPNDIIVRPDGTPVLLHLGLARQAIDVKKKVMGRKSHGASHAEERAMNEGLFEPWNEVHALAALLYRAVTGRAIDDPESAPPIEYALPRSVPPAVDFAAGRYRMNFLAAIDQALLLDPTKRPQTIEAFRDLTLAPYVAPDDPPPPAAALAEIDERPASPEGFGPWFTPVAVALALTGVCFIILVTL
jgi:serine/threonine protein kinase